MRTLWLLLIWIIMAQISIGQQVLRSNLQIVYTCNPDITYGYGGDFDPAEGQKLQDAIIALNNQKDKKNITLGILPGTYKLTKEQAEIRNGFDGHNLMICGTGKRPNLLVINGRNARWVLQETDILTVANLDLRHISITPSGKERYFADLVMRDYPNRKSVNSEDFDPLNSDRIQGECLTSGKMPQLYPENRGREGKRQIDPTDVIYMNFDNVRLANCGANRDHTTYFSARGCVLRANELHVEHNSGLEAFRSLCRVNVIKNSHFQNFLGDPSDVTEDTKSGVATLQTLSPSATIIDSTVFHVLTDGNHGTAYSQVARRSITSCDMPNQTPDEYYDGKFWDPRFWKEVRSKPVTDPFNPHIFPSFISNSSFILHNPGGGNATKTYMTEDEGTYPRKREKYFSPRSIYHDVPDPDDKGYKQVTSWIERSVTFWANNQNEGFEHLSDHSGAEPKSDSSHPDVLYPPPERKSIRFDSVPGWWPKKCAELQEIYTGWWDEGLPNHKGFPPCSGGVKLQSPSPLTASSNRDHTIKLEWQDNSEIETGFHVYYKEINEESFKLIDSTAADVTTLKLNFTDYHFDFSEVYTFYVTAVNSVGDTVWSNKDTVRTDYKKNCPQSEKVGELDNTFIDHRYPALYKSSGEINQRTFFSGKLINWIQHFKFF